MSVLSLTHASSAVAGVQTFTFALAGEFYKDVGSVISGWSKAGNLEYRGISLNIENSWNSQGILCNLREKF